MPFSSPYALPYPVHFSPRPGAISIFSSRVLGRKKEQMAHHPYQDQEQKARMTSSQQIR
jgi:hypothetical protein